LLDTPEACQDLMDHAAPPGYFSKLRHMHNEDFLWRYNINLARQVAMGSQLRLRFEQEAKLLRKFVAQVARRDQRIQARESEIKNLEALLETEAGMKRAAEEKSAGLSQELERMRVQFSKLQVSNERLSQQVDALQQQVSGEETLKAAFETTSDNKTRWVIGHRLRLAMMKCAESLEMRQAFADVVSVGIAKGMSEGLKHGVEHRHAQRTDDTGEDAPQFIRDLRPSSSQLSIPIYPEVCDPQNPWACKEEIKLTDAIAANISCAEQKKRSRIGLALLLVDAAMQTKSDDA
nr:hypothetical protein [Tanacetum cinerariifolium]